MKRKFLAAAPDAVGLFLYAAEQDSLQFLLKLQCPSQPGFFVFPNQICPNQAIVGRKHPKLLQAEGSQSCCRLKAAEGAACGAVFSCRGSRREPPGRYRFVLFCRKNVYEKVDFFVLSVYINAYELQTRKTCAKPCQMHIVPVKIGIICIIAQANEKVYIIVRTP